MPQTHSTRTSRPLAERIAGNLRLSAGALAVTAAVLLAADWGSRLAGDSVFPGGPLDECAHLATALLVLWALGQRLSDRFLLAALVTSAAIDFDHIPGRLGVDWLTAGTPRPYSHSLITIVLALVGARLWRERRDLALGIALGLAVHFWRDLADSSSGISLLWPVSTHPFSIPHEAYLVAMISVIVAAGLRASPHLRTRVRAPLADSAGR